MTLFFLFVLGTITGSLMNVCIYRMPRNESIVRPRSHCPVCGRTIPWFDNIPIASFLFLRGKCRFCKEKISLRYVIVEVLSGILVVLLFMRFGQTPHFFVFWYLASTLIVVSFIDLKFHEIPDEISLSGIVIGLCLSALYPPMMDTTEHLASLGRSFLGAVVGGGSIYILGFIGEFIFKKEAMGGGDVKLMAMIGAFIGWKLVLLTFFLAPFFGSIVGIALRLKEGRDVIPYGPHLSLAAMVSIFYGDTILNRLFLV